MVLLFLGRWIFPVHIKEFTAEQSNTLTAGIERAHCISGKIKIGKELDVGAVEGLGGDIL